MPKSAFHPFGTKTTTAVIIIIIVVLGISLSLFFSKALGDFAEQTRADSILKAIQMLAARHIEDPAYFINWQTKEAEDIFHHFIFDLEAAFPEVVEIKIYNDQSILIWARRAEAEIGKVHEKEDVAEALLGEPKSEYAEEKIAKELGFPNLWEIYTPIYLGREKPIGVVEVYFDTSALIAFIRRMQFLVWTLTFAATLLIALALHLTFRKQSEQLMKERQKYTEELENEVLKRTQRLEMLKEQYRAVVEGSLIGIYVMQDGVFKYVNSAFLKIFGYEKSEKVIGRPWQEFVPKEERKKVLESGVEERMKGKGVSTEYSFKGLKKDGTLIKIEVLSNPSFYEGKPAIIGSLQDITERKRLEGKLRESEEKYRSLVETVPVCIKVVDLKGKLIFLNKEGRDEHFIKEDADITKWDWLKTIKKEYRGTVGKVYDDALKGKDGMIEFAHTKEGSKHEWCFSIFAPVKDEFGKVKFVLSYSLNITERKRAEEKIRELNELRNKFIQIVSHQLRTPLNAIRWNLESLLGEELGKLKPEQKEFIRVSYRANVEVIGRINDLLITLDIEEGRLRKLTKTKVALESLWGSVMINFQKKCAQKNIVCQYKASSKPLPPVEIDAEKVRVILEKLSENAVDYTKEKGKIEVALKKVDKNVRFEITDNGIGIPKSEQPHIFERFYRATNAFTMKPDASGLGLFIAKYFAEQHGGKIEFKSEEGKGTTFSILLPISNNLAQSR